MSAQTDPPAQKDVNVSNNPPAPTHQPSSEPESNAQVAEILNEKSKDAIKAAAQATNEAEAKARAEMHSLSSKLRSLSRASLKKTDATIAHLSRLLATPSHTDTLLMTTSYSLSLLHAILTSATQARLRISAQAMLSKLRSAPLLPGETLIATISPSPHSLTYRLQTSSKTLARLIDDFRMFARLLSLVKMWSWGAATLRNPPAGDRLLTRVVWTQVLSCTAFQALENVGYLATKGVVDVSAEKIGKVYRWSARFWAVHVALEFVRLWRLRDLKIHGQGGVKQEKNTVEDDKVEAKWWRDLYSNAAWLPMTWHYSVNGGLIPDASVAVLGLIAGTLGLREAWRVSA